jgi:transposase
MGTGIRYSAEFKQEAVNQIVVHGYDVADVAKRLGVSTKSLYKWQKELAKPAQKRQEEQELQAEVARLKRELKRTQQERDILKEAAMFFASESKNATRS